MVSQKFLQITESWGIKSCGPENKCLDDLPGSRHQEPALLPEAIGEFTVDVSQPKLIGFADAGHGSELQKQRSTAGHVFALFGGAAACESKTQTVTASSSAEAEFVAAFTAAKAAQCLRLIL